MKNATAFKFYSSPKEGFPPMPERSGPPPLSILDPFLRAMEHRNKCIMEPPHGYGCIVVPKKAVMDREFAVEAVFASQPVDGQDAGQAAWWEGLTDDERRRFPVVVRVESTKAFDLSQQTQTVELGMLNRVVSTTFLVRPTVQGTHSLRVFLKYPGVYQEAVFNQPIRIRTKAMDVIQKVGIVVATLAGLIGLFEIVVNNLLG